MLFSADLPTLHGLVKPACTCVDISLDQWPQQSSPKPGEGLRQWCALQLVISARATSGEHTHTHRMVVDTRLSALVLEVTVVMSESRSQSSKESYLKEEHAKGCKAALAWRQTSGNRGALTKRSSSFHTHRSFTFLS